jgi:hypothetical protein
MRSEVLALVRLLAAAERGSRLTLLLNGLAIPLLLWYFLSRLDPAAPLAGRPAGALALCLGGPMAGVGYQCVVDRFAGRLALLRSAGAPSARAYAAARLALGVGQSVVVAAAALAVAWALGARPTGAGAAELLALMALAALCLCALAMLVAQLAREPGAGLLLTSLLAMLMALGSPVFVPAGLRTALAFSPYARLNGSLHAVLSGGAAQPADAAWLIATAAVCLLVLELAALRRPNDAP